MLSQIKAKILLRFNTVMKMIKQNFFSLLDNGVLVWGFEVLAQSMGAQTFSIVLQNTLTSVKGLYKYYIADKQNLSNRPVALCNYITTVEKSILKLARLPSLVSKYCKMLKI